MENQTLNVYVKTDENPSPTDYQWTKTVPENITDLEYPDLAYTLVLPAANLTNGSEIFVGVQLDECIPQDSCADIGDLLQYYISIQNGGCRTWDADNEVWNYENCKVSDKKIVFQWACLPLLDNFDNDEYEYEVHVYTGLKRHAGTKSEVYIHIFGENISTGIRHLNDGRREVNIIAMLLLQDMKMLFENKFDVKSLKLCSYKNLT